jgi:hypothetical protein
MGLLCYGFWDNNDECALLYIPNEKKPQVVGGVSKSTRYGIIDMTKYNCV